MVNLGGFWASWAARGFNRVPRILLFILVGIKMMKTRSLERVLDHFDVMLRLC